MSFRQRIASVFLALHAAQCYILLTANLDDIQAIYKQIAKSPMAIQLDNILHRASKLFKQQANKPTIHKRGFIADGSDGKQHEDRRAKTEDSPENTEDDVSDGNAQKNITPRRHQDDNELTNLGKNATFYLSSIQKIMDSIK